MKKCKHCQSKIDSKAKRCPKCKEDLRNWFVKHPILTGFLIIFLLIIFTPSGKNNSDTSTTPSTKQAQESTQEQQPITIQTANFIAEFDKNQLAAEEKYKNNVVQFTAYIGNISEDIMGQPFLSLQPTLDQYYFGTSIQCFFETKSELTSLENGQQVNIKGKVDTQSLGIISIKNCKVL